MSNQVVGNVYQQIIDKVIQASTSDFEEFGVDTSTLKEMKQVWQERLSGLKVATFPWDPQPEPPRQPATVPSNVPKQEPDITPTSATLPQQDQVNFPNVPIKAERSYEAPISSYPQQPAPDSYTGVSGPYAQQRAQALIQQRMGGNMPVQNPGQHGAHMQMAGQQQRMMQGQMPQGQRPPQQMQRPGGVYATQTDGADDASEDWNALMAAKAAEGDEGRIAADQFMRARVDAMSARMDSGLMIPLDEMPKGKKRKAAMRVLQQQQAAEAAEAGPSSIPVAPFDGELGAEDEKDEKTDDEDAINSDLDDPEDDLDNVNDENDDGVEYMLCTYDKVQRVKNKWKCTLKDGILMTNKKEYLFHKANGEFEW